jgi:SOS response regulatory protein OraA/RecX
LSRAELTARLIDRGFIRDDVEAALDRLAESQALDDRRAAFAHVRTASRLKGRGRRRIQHELEARGFSRDVVREALAEIPPDDDLDAIRRFVDRKRRTLDDTPQGRRRLFNQLVRRGFSAEMISRVLKKT